MKPDIHPAYHTDTKIVCACGNIIITGSTKPEIHIDTCSVCHPFYTGKQKLLDTSGVLDKFSRRAQKTATLKSRKQKTKA